MRTGVRLALDWGKARIGVAACDREAILAFPVETVDAYRNPIERLKELVFEYAPFELILGLPKTMAAKQGIAADNITKTAAALQQAFPDLPIRLVDERLSTKAASRLLQASGRTARKCLAVIDQAAAVGILEQAIEYERSTGLAPGELFVALEGLN